MELEKMNIDDYKLNSVHWVNATYINNPHSFYVRNKHYRKYQEAMELSKSLSNIDIALIKSGDAIIFKSNLKEKNIRGDIIYIDKNEEVCDIFAVDHGFLETCVAFESIYNLTEACQRLNLPPLAIHCQLNNCEPFNGETWTPEATQAMKTFIGDGKHKIKMTIRGQINRKYLVDLEGPSLYDAATLLILTGYSCMTGSNNSVSKISVPKSEKHYFTFKVINVGETLHVRVVSGKFLEGFYVSEISDYHKYVEDRDTLSHYPMRLVDLRKDDITEGRPVCIWKGSKYERAIVKEVRNAKEVIVQLIDTGAIEQVSLSRVKKMTEIFFNRPAAAIYCSLDKSQSLDYRLQKFLVFGYEFLITVRQKGSQFETPYIVDILKLP